MPITVTSGTDVAWHALYDAGTAAGELDDIESRVARGELLVIDTASDGELGYLVCIDEPLPDAYRSHVRAHTPDLLLRVPSGRLQASGAEEIGTTGPHLKTFELPAGTYLADIYELDYDWDRDIEPVLERELGPDVHRESRAGTSGGILIVGGLLAFFAGLFTWTLPVLGAGVAAIALGALVLYLGLPRAAYFERKQAIALRFPPFVIVLRRLADDADTSRYKGLIVRWA